MPRFQPEELLRALERHGVRYILIGGLAATLHGSPLRTGDADICPARDPENLERLAAALKEMKARIRAADAPEGLAFAWDGQLPHRGGSPQREARPCAPFSSEVLQSRRRDAGHSERLANPD